MALKMICSDSTCTSLRESVRDLQLQLDSNNFVGFRVEGIVL